MWKRKRRRVREWKRGKRTEDVEEEEERVREWKRGKRTEDVEEEEESQGVEER